MLSPKFVHVTRWGDTRPKVVLVHGSAQGSGIEGDVHFNAQRPLGDQGWQLIVPDRPGHGRSPTRSRPDDAQADAIWVTNLLGDGAHLVGHSFGVCVALAAAARCPEPVRSLTLIEPAMQKLAIDDPLVRRFVLKVAATMILSFSPEHRATRFAKLLDIPDEIRGGKTQEELKAMGRAIAKLKVPDAATLRDELETIKRGRIPLLVVTGGWSFAFDNVGERVAGAGGGRHVVVASPNHFPNMVAEFNPLLADFMTRADAPAGSRLAAQSH